MKLKKVQNYSQATEQIQTPRLDPTPRIWFLNLTPLHNRLRHKIQIAQKFKPHRNSLPCIALVFKNVLFGLANFLGGKIIWYCQILIFSYPPFRLVWTPNNRENGTHARLIPFWTMDLVRTNPVFRFDFGGWTQFSNPSLLEGLEGAEILRF